MMRVAVVSDSHGNARALARLAGLLKEKGITLALHLGDDYRDAAFLASRGLEVVGVPGVYCPEYADARIPNRRRVELAGVKLFLTHTDSRHRHDRPGDPDPQEEAWEADLILYGHTHVPALEERESGWWLNPGHLKGPMDRGQPATYALLTFQGREVEVEIRRLEDDGLVLGRKLSLPA
jgi:putative phosphoesterase